MPPRHIILLLAFALGVGLQAQVCGKKDLVTTLGVGGGGGTFTQANGPSDLMRGSVVVSFAFRYGLGKRLSAAFRYDRIGVRRSILEAGPSRMASYQLDLHYVIARSDRSEVDIGMGAGLANLSLGAHTARLPREAHAGLLAAGVRWSKMLTPTIGFYLAGQWMTTAEEPISDEDGVVKDANGEPIRIGFRSIAAETGILVRF